MIEKKSFQKACEDNSRKMLELGEKLRRFGFVATIGLTLPILLTIFLGPLGLGIGVFLFIAMIGGLFSKKKKESDHHERY